MLLIVEGLAQTHTNFVSQINLKFLLQLSCKKQASLSEASEDDVAAQFYTERAVPVCVTGQQGDNIKIHRDGKTRAATIDQQRDK